MNIVVVGAGAVGGYFGVRLARAGANVTFLVRESRRQQILENGLVLHSVQGDDRLDRVQLTTDASTIESPDLVILSVKNYHLNGVMPALQTLAAKGALILPLLNGIEHVELLQAALGKAAVLGGLCTLITTLDERGHIVHISQAHDLTFGALQPSQAEFCEKAQSVFSMANMGSRLSQDIYSDMWAKYVFITAFSGVTTASRLTIGYVMDVEATKRVYVQTIDELLAVAVHNGAKLPENLNEQLLQRAVQFPRESTSSMHQDFRKGLTLEVESLQGAAVRLAARAGLSVPTIETLYGLIKPYENGSPEATTL